MNWDSNDEHSLALVAWRESRGEGQQGCIATMWVCRNRATAWDKSPHDVIYGKNQFSSMSIPSDREFNLDPEQSIGVDRAMWEYCKGAAPAVISGATPDPTNGALWYENPRWDKSPWFLGHIRGNPQSHPVVARIGQQVFYR